MSNTKIPFCYRATLIRSAGNLFLRHSPFSLHPALHFLHLSLFSFDILAQKSHAHLLHDRAHSEKWALDSMLAGLRHNAMNNVKSPGDHISFRLSLTPRMSPVFTQTFPRNGMVLCGHSSCTLECCVLYVWGYLPLRGESLQRIKLLPAHEVFRTPVEEHSACALLHLFVPL